jgi:nitrate/nitrite transporter NarK
VVGRAGDIATFAGWPYLADAWSIEGAMYVVSIVCGFSFFCAIMCAWMDKKAESYAEEEGEEETIHEDYSLRGVLKFPWAYWISCILVMIFYSCIVPFQNLAPGFLQSNYGISPEASGWYTSIISMVSLIASPLLGLALDRWGFRIYFIQVGLLCMILGFSMLMMPPITSPIPSLVLLGLSFSIIPAALWPCLVILVPSNLFGTAYGIMEAMINAGNVAMYYGITALLSGNDFFTAIMIFLFMAFVGVLLSIVWLVLDLKTGNWCNLPTVVQVQYNEREVPLEKNVVKSPIESRISSKAKDITSMDEMSVTESETVHLLLGQ